MFLLCGTFLCLTFTFVPWLLLRLEALTTRGAPACPPWINMANTWVDEISMSVLSACTLWQG